MHLTCMSCACVKLSALHKHVNLCPRCSVHLFIIIRSRSKSVCVCVYVCVSTLILALQAIPCGLRAILTALAQPEDEN